jgi:MFS family permease
MLRALRKRNFRYLLFGYAISSSGDWLYGVALTVYVFELTHSAAWVAAAIIGRLLPLMLFGPVGGLIADRYDRRVVMIVSDLGRAAIMLVLTAVAAASGAAAIAIALAALSNLGTTVSAPALTAITPAVVGEDDLAPANALISTVENVALATGPALGGILLLLGSPTLAFAVNAVTFLVSAITVIAVRPTQEMRPEPGGAEPVVKRLGDGFRALFSSADLVTLIAVMLVATVIYGAENVLFVLISEDLLGTGSAGVGFLFAGVGVGGILAAALSSRLASSLRLGRVLAVAMLMPGVALASLALITTPWIAYAVVALDGMGSIVIDVVAMTMLQRLIKREVLARVFGVLMSLAVLGTLVGSLVTPWLVSSLGLRWAIVATAAVPVIALLAAAPRFRALSAQAAARAEKVGGTVDLLHGLSLFEGAPRRTLELLASSVTEQRVAAGETVVAEGDPADALYVVRSGTLEVIASTKTRKRTLTTLGPGDYFGEIGLLRGSPRTATVRARTDCLLLRIPGEDFLSILNQAPTVSALVVEGMGTRLARSAQAFARRSRASATDVAGPS